MDGGSSWRFDSTATCDVGRPLCSMQTSDSPRTEIRIAYVVYRLSTIFLSTSSVQHFGRQVYKLSATNRGCLQVEYSSTAVDRTDADSAGSSSISVQRGATGHRQQSGS